MSVYAIISFFIILMVMSALMDTIADGSTAAAAMANAGPAAVLFLAIPLFLIVIFLVALATGMRG